MKWFILFVGIVVLCGVAALLLGRLGGGLGGATSSLSHEPLPDDTLSDDDLDELRFDVALRGYRMGQVDGVLARLRRELRDKDDELAVLRAGQTVESASGEGAAEQTAPGPTTSPGDAAGAPAEGEQAKGEPAEVETAEVETAEGETAEGEQEQSGGESTPVVRRAEGS